MPTILFLAGTSLRSFIHSAFFILLFCLLLSGCSTTLTHQDGKPTNFNSINPNDYPNAVPKVEPRSKYGNPASYVINGQRYYVLKSAQGYKEKGIASWYGTKFHEKRTSSGEPYNMYAMTAASPVLPLPTYVRVTNLKTGQWAIVKVNDRGPFHPNRIIDLSLVAAKKVGVAQTGTAYVEVEALDPATYNQKPAVSPAYYKAHRTQVYLQLGAFSTRRDAEKLVAQIKQITSRTTHIVLDNRSSKILYKVQIGPLASVEEVDALTTTFKQSGLGNAFAVVR